MARKIPKVKEPLILNGVEVRDLETLRENFNVETLIEYLADGKLVNWLRARYYEDEAEKVSALTKDAPELTDKLCEIFEVAPPVDESEINWRNERLERLKNFTNDEKILSKVDNVAFTQEDLGDLLDENISEIYLCGGKFIIPLKVSNKKYIGVGDAVAVIRSKKLVDFDALNISFKNIKFNAEYEKVEIAMAEEFFKQGKDELAAENYKSAFNLFQKAGAMKNSDAVRTIGEMYEKGLGIPFNDKKAVDYFITAAHFGNAEAMLYLGGRYSLGKNIEQNDQKAFEWYEKAAAAGNTVAMLIVSRRYQEGKGVWQDDSKAFNWYLKAAEAGNSTAMIMLADCYSYSKGTEQNDGAAFYWYEKAANAGNVDAMLIVSDCYQNGKGVAQDNEKVLEWYLKAAQAGISAKNS